MIGEWPVPSSPKKFLTELPYPTTLTAKPSPIGCKKSNSGELKRYALFRVRDLTVASALNSWPTGVTLTLVLVAAYPIPPDITFTSVIFPASLTIDLRIAPVAVVAALTTVWSGGPT